MRLTGSRKNAVEMEDRAEGVDVGHRYRMAQESQFPRRTVGAEVYVLGFRIYYNALGVWFGYAGG